MSGDVTLYGHWTCPFVHRVAWALAERGIALPVYWGNRNAAPFLDDAVAQLVHRRQQDAGRVAARRLGKVQLRWRLRGCGGR
mgnify:CR=1 FL=1